MKVTIEFDVDAGVRRHIVRGKLDFDELRSTLGGVYESPDFRADQDVLWDLREADVESFSTAEVKAVAEFVRRNWGTSGSPRAALVASDDFVFAMTRMYEQLLDPAADAEIRVFRSMEDAEEWLRSRE